MAFSLDNLKYINTATCDLVNGYIREFQALLPAKNTYFIIPNVINYICMIFYANTWDVDNMSIHCELKENTVKQIDRSHSSTFLVNIIDSGRHSWKFKISFGKDRYAWSHLIGIWTVNPAANESQIGGGYGFVASQGVICSPGFSSVELNYGIKCKSNDIIDMCLDMDLLTLSFGINDVDYGIAYSNITPGKYRAAVNLFAQGDTVELL
eukprot:346909_1